ncbi:MAG TPA: carbohydrate ABC transporter permease [Bacillota bacterium]|nr:carbohydrate ABC transporter permease [Bacillota bacterium]
MGMKGNVRPKRSVKNVLYQILCLAVGIVIILPIIMAVCISFMRPEEILTKELHFFPNSFRYLENYKIVFSQTRILRFMFNSLVVAFVSSVVRVVTASLAAFSFAFFDYKGKRLLFALVVGSMIIPADVLIVQNYFTTAELGLINTYLGMMVVFFVSATNIFMMRQTFLSYSRSLREAAMIDGCGNFEFFIRILMPSNIPVITTVFISSFVGIWNTYLWPLLVTNANEMRTAQVAVTMLNINEGSSYGPGAVMAAAVIILIPSILVFLLLQKRIVGGIMSGAVKG